MADIQPAIAVVINEPRSFTISEPTDGYGNPADAGPGLPMWTPGAEDGEGAYVPPIDVPLDSFDVNETKPHYRMIHLQRLANPLLPWNPEGGEPGHNPNLQLNPYMTIDSMAVDLTVFNGLADGDQDPDVTDGNTMFATLQRGQNDQGSEQFRRLWSHERANQPGDIVDPGTNPADMHHFKYTLEHSLGYLNDNYQPAFTAGDAPLSPPGTPGMNPYIGAPRSSSANANEPPFPWLTWLNRPFVSQYELMQVPTDIFFAFVDDVFNGSYRWSK